MKNPIIPRLISILALAVATAAVAQPDANKNVIVRGHAIKGEAGHPATFTYAASKSLETEKVAYLGVETMPVDPTVAAQLGLPRGTGIVVRRVAEGSPAENLLQPHDVLTKLDDQILVNMAQLTVLVRNHKASDEVKLTYVRSGKESSAKIKLGERDVPKVLAWEGTATAPALQVFGHPIAGASAGTFSRAVPAMPLLPGASGAISVGPGMPLHEEASDVMRVIGGDRMHWFQQPRVHVLRRAGGMGSTILDLAAGNFVFSDDDGSVEVNATDGKRELTVKDKDGKVTFQGPINTPEDHAKLPNEVKERINAIGGADFGTENEGIKIETKSFSPATKVDFEFRLPDDAASANEPGLRTL